MSPGFRQLVTAVLLMVALPTGMAASYSLDPGPTPTSAESQAAPATILAYTGHGGFDAGYTKLASATGNDLVEQATWPQDLGAYRCALLSAPTIAFDQAHVDALATYLAGGGVVLALAETPSFDDGASARTVDALLTALGSDLGVAEHAVDSGFLVTDRIEEIAPTVGVDDLEYAGPTEVTVAGTGIGLARALPGAWLVAAEPMGQGVLVAGGDTNMLSDRSFKAFTTHSNGQLADNLCNGVPTEIHAQPLLGDPTTEERVHTPEMRARLTTQHENRPVPGHLVTFHSHGEPVCQALTDDGGVALCEQLEATLEAVRTGGYQAHAEAAFLYPAASSQAALLGIGGQPVPP